MAEDNAISELNLGFRELFRILLPGIYAVALTNWLAPTSPLARFASEGNAHALVASFFIGLVGAALVVHETWFPYTSSFERWRILLNTELGGGADRVHEYKYFLETRGHDIKDRIHYFSSFYYMLVELSLFSAIAAVSMAFCFFESVEPHDHWMWASRALIAAALVMQLFLRGSLRERKDWIARLQLGPLALLAIWLVLHLVRLWLFWPAVLPEPGFPTGPMLCLGVATYTFARLGAKHWKSVIKEQVVFVREHADEIRDLPRADS